MQNAHRTSLLRQTWVVLLSYLTRPGVRGSALAVSAGYLVSLIMERVIHLGHGSDYTYTATILLQGASHLSILCGLVALLSIYFLHAHYQLMGLPARLMPNFRNLNLGVAGVLLVLIAAAFAGLPLFHGGSYEVAFGVFILALAFLIATCHAVCRLWLVPILGLCLLYLVRFTSLEYHLTLITSDLDKQYLQSGNETRIVTSLRHWNWMNHVQYVWTLRVSVLLADALGFIALGWVARPRTPRTTLMSTLRRLIPMRKESVRLSPDRRRQLAMSRFSHSLHRRFAVHDWRAAGVAAIAMAGLTVWFCLQFGSSTAIPMLTMLLAFLPGALVAIGWRERWPNYDFESLYPVSRKQFVGDMATGLLFEAAEFWIAAVSATLLACICVRVDALRDGRFWAALLAGAMMQFLWVGGIFFVGQRRQLTSYIAGLTPIVLAMFLPLEALWRWDQPITGRATVLIALVEMLLGVTVFAMTWAYLQRARSAGPSMPGMPGTASPCA